MAKLPRRELPTSSVLIFGEKVEVRGLSRTEALHFMAAHNEEAMPDASIEDRVEAAEVYLLVTCVGVTEADAKEFRETQSADDVEKVLQAILAVSGLTEKDGKDPQADTSEPSQKADSTPSTSPSLSPSEV